MRQKNKIYRISAPKIKLVTKGYIHIIDNLHIEANKKGNPIIYKTKKSFLRQKTFENLKNKLSKKFNQCFALASFLESKILIVKNMINKAHLMCEDSFIKADLYIQLAKANLRLKTFKYSLPHNIRINLF